MAPIAVFDMLSSFSSAEVGIISLIIFLILSISLVALCNDCTRGSGNAYDVNKGAKVDGKDSTPSWRDHKNMPVNTLDRTMHAHP